MKTTIFKIEGMHCDACANTIRTIVEQEPGVRMASVSFTDRIARVLYDPQTIAEARLVDAIQRPGFRVVGRDATGEGTRRRGADAMSIATGTAATFVPWSEEPSARPDRRKIRARIGGLHCSLCTGTIEKVLFHFTLTAVTALDKRPGWRGAWGPVVRTHGPNA